MEIKNDEFYMRRALELAREAEAIDEVPVGAVAVRDGEIIAEAYNTREKTRCATHHAEVLCIERACAALGGWRLPGVTLYVTMEPCAMCAGAIINARVERVVYGARDMKEKEEIHRAYGCVWPSLVGSSVHGFDDTVHQLLQRSVWPSRTGSGDFGS